MTVAINNKQDWARCSKPRCGWPQIVVDTHDGLLIPEAEHAHVTGVLRTVMDIAELKRLRWRCRRGLRELDLVLQPFFDEYYTTLAESEQAAFRRLLSLPDPTLLAYINGSEQPADEELAGLVRKIRR